MDKCNQCETLKRKITDLDALLSLNNKVIHQQNKALMTKDVAINSMKLLIDKHESLFGSVVEATREWRELHAELKR